MENLNLSKIDFFADKSSLKRVECSKCYKKVKYFCYDCCLMVIKEELPVVNLPFKVTILKDKRELNGKSTAIHAKLLAPNDVEIVDFNQVELEKNQDPHTYVLYPGEDSYNIMEDELPFEIKKLLVIDGTWRQSKSMIKSLNLKKISFSPQKTFFWRYQSIGESCLSTIEAIYHFFKQYHQVKINSFYDGRYDDLLLFFIHFYNLIQDHYKSNKNLHYTRKKSHDYIKYH